MTLLPSTAEDFATLISWIDSEDMLVQFSGTLYQYPLTEAQLYENMADSKRHNYKLTDGNGRMTGYGEIILLPEDNRAHLCRLLIGNSMQRGKGLGLYLTEALLKIAFNELDATCASLNVYDYNTAAIRCYEKAGFVTDMQKTSTQEYNGKKLTSLRMILQKEDWQSRHDTL